MIGFSGIVLLFVNRQLCVTSSNITHADSCIAPMLVGFLNEVGNTVLVKSIQISVISRSTLSQRKLTSALAYLHSRSQIKTFPIAERDILQTICQVTTFYEHVEIAGVHFVIATIRKFGNADFRQPTNDSLLAKLLFFLEFYGRADAHVAHDG